MSILPHHDILGFEVSINDVDRMEVLQSENHFRRIDSDIFLCESDLFNEVASEVFPVAVLQAEVDIAGSLECEVEGNYERVPDLLEDVDF